MPLLDAVWQSKITARYNIVGEGTAVLEQSLENSASSVHCSLFTDHCEAVAVWQSKITARYNTANQIADVEGIGELKLVSSLITHHSSFTFRSSPLSGAYNPAKHHSKIAQRRAGGPQSFPFSPPCCLERGKTPQTSPLGSVAPEHLFRDTHHILNKTISSAVDGVSP
jgi:hypothetical protein